MYSAAVGWNVSYISVRFTWYKVCFKCSVSFLMDLTESEEVARVHRTIHKRYSSYKFLSYNS